MGLAMKSMKTFIIHKREMKKRCITSELIFFQLLPILITQTSFSFLGCSHSLHSLNMSFGYLSINSCTFLSSLSTGILYLLSSNHQADIHRLSCNKL